MLYVLEIVIEPASGECPTSEQLKKVADVAGKELPGKILAFNTRVITSTFPSSIAYKVKHNDSLS